MIVSTEQLVEEHKVIKDALRILEKICDKLESREKVDPEHIEQLIDFIRTFADKCHHGKEEDLLFQAMEDARIPSKGRPDEENVFYALLVEHFLGRDYVKGMADGITKYKAGDKRASYRIIENARDYVELLRQHIEKEDDIVYLIADSNLSEEKKKELLKKFDEVEKEKIGIGVHEKYHALIENYKQIYLEKQENSM
jgi:hemerythrin-like domain-containing protein